MLLGPCGMKKEDGDEPGQGSGILWVRGCPRGLWGQRGQPGAGSGQRFHLPTCLPSAGKAARCQMPASGPDVYSLLHLCRSRLQPSAAWCETTGVL